MRQPILGCVDKKLLYLRRCERLSLGSVGHPGAVLIVNVGRRVPEPDLEKDDAEGVYIVEAREVLLGRVAVRVAVEGDFEVVDGGSGRLAFLMAGVFKIGQVGRFDHCFLFVLELGEEYD